MDTFVIKMETLKELNEFVQENESKLLEGYKNVSKNRCNSFSRFISMVFGYKLQAEHFHNGGVELQKIARNPNCFNHPIGNVNDWIDSAISFYGSNDNSNFKK